MLYRPVHQVLSVIQIKGVSAFQGDVCIFRIELIVGNLKSACLHNQGVRFSGVSARQVFTV